MYYIAITICLYCIPLWNVHNMSENMLYNEQYNALIAIIFTKIFLLSYYLYFVYNYKLYRRIHEKIILTLLISIFSKLLICLNVNNTIYLDNKPYYVFRWCEWIATIYLMMYIILDMSKDQKHNKYLKINIVCQVLCILFGYISLYSHFIFFSIISTLFHLYVIYAIYKTKNVSLIYFELISIVIMYYYFMYYFDVVNARDYHISMWICEILIKGIIVILSTMYYMLKREAELSDYISKEQLYYIIHDLRINLNNLSLGICNLEDNNITNILKVSVKSMMETINQILLFHKIRKNQFTIEKDFFSIKDTLNDVVKEFYFELQKKNIIYEINIENDYLIYGDKKWIRQMFINLLSNALKYTKTSIKIDIKYLRNDVNHEQVIYFAVSDDGDGVPSYFVPELFKAFSQNVETHNSSGIGLYLVSNIVKAHNGFIDYKYDNGAVFYGEINTSYKPNILRKYALLTEHNDIYFYKHFVGHSIKKILIADDSILTRVLVKRVLEEINDFVILEASNGREAVELYDQHHDIDLIFIDYHMPILTGKQTLQILKDHGYIKNVVLITGLINEEEIKNIDVNYILIKPIEKNILIKIFQKEKLILNSNTTTL